MKEASVQLYIRKPIGRSGDGMDLLQTAMSELNGSLAVQKPSLESMMDGERSYHLRDGSVIEVPPEQLKIIWDACDDSERIRLRVPIYVKTDVSGDTPAWCVEGKAEASVISKLLNRNLAREDYLKLYNPDLKMLKKLIPDCYLMVFSF